MSSWYCPPTSPADLQQLSYCHPDTTDISDNQVGLHVQSSKVMNALRLLSFMHVLARVTAETPWSVSAADLRRDLHWLPINQRVTYKLSILTYKALHTGQPCYLADLLDLYRPCLLYTSPSPRD